jgi:hypothetical protein
MLAPIQMKLTAFRVGAVTPIDNICTFSVPRRAAALALAWSLTGCMPATAPLIGADPADPAAKTARTEYRSTIAPYTATRPGEPGPWVEQNRRVAPAPKSGQ